MPPTMLQCIVRHVQEQALQQRISPTHTQGNLIPDAHSVVSEDTYLQAGFSRAHSQSGSLGFTWEP